MKSMFPFLLVGVLFAIPCGAQGITLKSGEVVIGRVVDVDDTTLKVAVTFPKLEVRELPRADVAPRSIYSVLASRIDRDSGKAHLDLAGTCDELGLFAFGIAEAREAAALDPSLAPKAKRMEREFREKIAMQILRAAEADFVDGRLGAAERTVHAIVRDYADTSVVSEARKLAKKIVRRKNPAAREASAREIDAAVKKTRRALEIAAKDLDVPVHGRMRHQRALQQAIRRLEKVWKEVGDLVGPPTEPVSTTSAVSPTERLAAAQSDLRKRLTAAYLALGTIYLERRALPDADEWCNKACDLDPENKRSHALHTLILQAKIVNGWGY